MALEKSVQRLTASRDGGAGAVVAARAEPQRTLDALGPQRVALEHAPASAREARLRTLLQAPELQKVHIRAPCKPTVFLKCSSDTAPFEGLRNFPLHLVDTGSSPITLSATLTGLKSSSTPSWAAAS